MNRRDQDGDDFLKSVSDDLQESHSDIDDVTGLELKRRRQLALSHLKHKHFSRPILWSTTMIGALASVVILVFVLQFLSPLNYGETNFEDLPLLSSSDDIELYEDIEFIYWLEYESSYGIDEHDNSVSAPS